VSKESPLGRLSGTDNLFQLESEVYSPNPLVLQVRSSERTRTRERRLRGTRSTAGGTHTHPRLALPSRGESRVGLAGRVHTPRRGTHPFFAVKKLRIVNVWAFGWEIAHAAVSRRPPIPLDTIIARTHMYTYAASVWDLSVVQNTISCRPVPNPNTSIRNFVTSL
jgi:hypothetical protein